MNPSAPPPRVPSSTGQVPPSAPKKPPVAISDGRKLVIAAVTLVGVIVLTTLVFMLNSSSFDAAPSTQAANQVAVQRPSLDEPNSGHKPTSSGDRGGWEQLALLGLLVTAVGGGATRLVLSSRKARRANGSLVRR